MNVFEHKLFILKAFFTNAGICCDMAIYMMITFANSLDPDHIR